MSVQPVPIAVVGIGCRFPGGAHDPDKLWELLSKGKDAWTESPPNRFNGSSFHHPDADMQGATNHRGGHFIEQDVAAFDSRFFGITAGEAAAMDPQQRLLLEVAFEALESAGIPAESIQGSKSGVYVATFTHDYESMMMKDSNVVPKYLLVGIGQAILSNRISYVFDLKGPSLTLDTACSGSLVALHLACQSLRTGESNMVLAGGTNLILSPEVMIPMSLLHFLNSDGKSYAFDSRGDGYGRGEGVGMVVLKRLDDALAAGDPIRAIIRNTGVAQDGKTAGITLPNGLAQETLIRSVYDAAGLDPRQTTYIEAHGTGTIAGDNTELSAIAHAFSASERDAPLFVGSIKANVGHLESSSGIAGVIKAVIALEKGFIPPQPDFGELKEGMISGEWNIQVPRQLTPWPTGALKRASVNSFGYGGTNAHAVLDAASGNLPPTGTDAHLNGQRLHGGCKTTADGVIEAYSATNGATHLQNGEVASHKLNLQAQPLQIFAVTAKSESSLAESLNNLREWLTVQDDAGEYMEHLAHTLTARRSIMPWRHTVVAATPKDLIAALGTKPAVKRSSGTGQIIFIFTGQGSQWFAMGRELIASSAVFKESLLRSERILQELGAPWRLISELLLDVAHSRVDQSEIGQPATTAIQIALIDFFQSLGIKPHIVVGHSSGEIAAAFAAGALTHETALKVSYHRSFLARRCKEIMKRKGAMMAVGLGEMEVSPYIARLQFGSAVVACVNSPSSTTISGDITAIDELHEILEKAGVFARKLKVDTAYHSHHMKSVADSYLKAMGDLPQGQTTSVQLFSSVTGEKKSSGFSASYWVQNLVSPVRFSDALANVCRELGQSQNLSSHSFLEIGPHNALAGPMRQIFATQMSLDSSQLQSLPSLVRGRDAVQTVLESTGKLFETGYHVDLSAANALNGAGQPLRTVSNLPPYAWDHSVTHWCESRLSRDFRLRPHPSHDLLGLRVVGSSLHEPIWRHIVSVDSLPWLQEHVVDGYATFPAAGYIAMAIEARKQVTAERQIQGPIDKFVLRDLTFMKALIIPALPAISELYLSFRSRKNMKGISSWDDFRVSSVSSDGSWHDHCHGSIITEHLPVKDEPDASRILEDGFEAEEFQAKLQALHASQPRTVTQSQLYQDMEAKGNFYGTNFANIKRLDIGTYDASGVIEVPDVAKSMPASYMQPHVIHPGTLDALIHSCLPIFSQHSDVGSVFTLGIREMVVSASLLSTPGVELRFLTSIAMQGLSSAAIDLSASYENADLGEGLAIKVTGGELRGVAQESHIEEEQSHRQGMTYRLNWGRDLGLCKPSACLLEDELGHDNVTPEEKLRLLNQAVSFFIGRCLKEVDPERVQPENMDYYRWMMRFDKSDISKTLAEGMLDQPVGTYIQQVTNLGPDGEAVCRIGTNLVPILYNDLDALELMLKDNLLFRAYTDDASKRLYAQMLHLMKQLTFKNPDMVVLEIGAGTGGATLPLLKGLSQNGKLPLKRYDFTDVSAGFFEHARPLFQEWESFMRFQALDLELDPEKQGFELGSYDVIIASNAIHVAANIGSALTDLQRLLKPGGRLVLIEMTTLTPYINLLLGMFPTWTIGTDEGRTDSPFLSVDQWNKTLLSSSFGGVELAVDDYNSTAQRMSLITSRSLPRQMEDHSQTRVVLASILDCSVAHSELCHRLMRTFKQKGVPVSFASLPVKSVDRNDVYVLLDDINEPILRNKDPAVFKGITEFLMKAERLLWVSVAHESTATTNAISGLVTGLTRSARVENESLKVVTLEMQQSTVEDSPDFPATIFDIVVKTFLRAQASDELEYVYNKGELFIPRLMPDEKVNSLVQGTVSIPQQEMGLFHQLDRPLKLHVETLGLLDTLQFVDDEVATSPLKPFQIEVQAMAHGINFKDVIVALGQIKPTFTMVGECAGVITAVGADFKDRYQVGDRVCAWTGTPYASRARVHSHNAYPLPTTMSFTLGASIPVTYVTAYYGLMELANLQADQSVLIHAATGGVGQAAIQIAQHIGSKIYATVGSATKRQFLIDTFGIPNEHIFSSRSGTFKKSILRLTENRGVDVVLNSLSGELLRDSWACVSPFGSFIEIGKTDILAKNSISMEPFDKNVTFASVDLAAISALRPETNVKRISYVMSMFESGAYTPIQPITTMPITNIENAFRQLQGGKNIGKLVLESDDTTQVKTIPRGEQSISFPGNGTYVIAGGLGGLGTEIARFMATRGAKNIVLLTRRRLSAEDWQALNEEFQALGTNIRVVTCDISDRAQCEKMASFSINDMPPVKGVVHAAMVLQDILVEHMELDDFEVALKPKMMGTQYLSGVLDMPALDFFVMLSSAVSVLGTRGVANYSAGNGFQDAFANISRPASSAHYVAINLGAMKESGVLARITKLDEIINAQGVIPLSNNNLFSLLEYAMSERAREDKCHQIVVGFNRESLTRASRLQTLENPMLSHLPRHDVGSSKAHSSDTSLETTIAAAQDIKEVQNIIAESVVLKISTLVVIDVEQIARDVPMVDFGLDSLVVIEIKNWIARTFQASLPTSEIFDAPSINSLASTIASKSLLVAKLLEDGDSKAVAKTDTNGELPGDGSSNATVLPRQPIPNLDESLARFLEVASALSNGRDEELEMTRRNVHEFAKAGGPGRRLHDRLVASANDPENQNWYSTLFLKGNYLQDRSPLPHFFGAHPQPRTMLKPAELATKIALGALQCKQEIEADKIDGAVLADQALHTHLYKWLFNSCREPHVREDLLRKYEGGDYLVALRNGNCFKIMLREHGETITYAQLKATFEAILKISHEQESWVNLLTADGRDEWAEYRELLKQVSKTNEDSLRAVEAAAFIICLDDASPESSSEKAYHFECSNGRNRWYDKALQFVICDNGVSATICNHTMMDGTSVAPIRQFVKEIITAEHPSKDETVDEKHQQKFQIRLGDLWLPFSSNPQIDDRIEQVRRAQEIHRSQVSFASFDVSTVSNDFFRHLRCAPKPGVQLLIQLACYRLFGRYMPAVDVVSMAHYAEGRVVLNQVIVPEVVEFCNAFCSSTSSAHDRRAAFFTAATTLAKSAHQATQGNSMDCHMRALRWMIGGEESQPGLFADPNFTSMLAPRVATDCLETDLVECGGPLGVPQSFFIHFQVYDDRVFFSTWGQEIGAEDFRKGIQEAAEHFKSVLS